MRSYAGLLDCLVYTQSRNRKVALLGRYFRSTQDPDRGWALASLTDGVPIRLPLRRMLIDLVSRFIDPVLYRLSRDYVGDTAETVSLLWPNGPVDSFTPSRKGDGMRERDFLTLDTVIDEMSDGTTAERTERLGRLLDQLDASGRWALLKLLDGAPRVGVSARLARTALAECYGRDVSEIEEVWHALKPPYLDLFAWLDGHAERPDAGLKPVFRPVMLAHPIEEEDWPKLAPEDFAAEWKWDGIRVQIAAHGGDVRMFSRQGDDISGAFPEIRVAFHNCDCVLDGKLLVMQGSEIAPFNELQQRRNRKTVTAKMMSAYPSHVRLYDFLFDGREDLRERPFNERRARLEIWQTRHQPPLTDISPLVAFASFDELGTLWSSARAEGIEGLMLKRRDGAYQAGRVKGQWFK